MRVTYKLCGEMNFVMCCGGPVVSKTTFACHIEFGSAIAKLDIRHCVIRKYTVARSVSDHPVRSPIGVVRSVIYLCGHRSRLCGQ